MTSSIEKITHGTDLVNNGDATATEFGTEAPATDFESPVAVVPQISPCFNSLPPEIRLMVWRYVARQPRVVEIRRVKIQRLCMFYDTEEPYQREDCDWEFRVVGNLPPAILHVNREARSEALNFYLLGSLNGQQYPTYLSIDSDVIYLAFDFYELGLDRWNIAWSEHFENHGWSKKALNRIAIRMDYFDSDIRFTCSVVNFLKIKEIILLDQTGAEDPVKEGELYPSLNLSRNLSLITLSPLDLVKRQITYGPAYHPHPDTSGIIDVKQYLAMARRMFREEREMTPWNSIEDEDSETQNDKSQDDENQDEVDQSEEDQDEEKEKDQKEKKNVLKKFCPIITAMRLKFREPDGKEAQGGIRQIFIV